MGFLALLLVAVAAWLIFTGRLQRMSMKDGLMLGLAIVGAIMAAKGQPLYGGAALAISALHGWRRLSSPARKRKATASIASPATAAAGSDSLAEARALLGLDENADEAAIRAAHRRLIAKIHPDAGGTEALAEKINEARAILLRHLVEKPDSHHAASGSPHKPTGHL